MLPSEKLCRICGVVKERDDFYAREGSPDGLRNDCKECTRRRSSNSPSKLAQKAAAAERRQTSEPFDPASYKAQWYQENRLRLSAAQAAWSAAHPEEMRAYRRRWQKANPGNGRKTSAAYLARKMGADTRMISDRDLARLTGRHQGLCAYCLELPWKHLDHVIPLSRGGRHAIGNLLPACQPCNQSKGPKLLAEWKMDQKTRLRSARSGFSDA